MVLNRRLPAEWEAQSGVLMAWPHADSDWADCLPAAQACVAAIGAAISQYEILLMISTEPESTRSALAAAGAVAERVRVVEQAVGDTWCRDYGAITVMENDQPLLLDFGFNGWGLKFPAVDDNLASRRLHQAGCLGVHPLHTLGLIIEGGSLESDGAGTVLSTTSCLHQRNRNPHLSADQLAAELSCSLGVQRLLLLEHGHLQGDDTDGHIDTLARLCPDHTMVFVSCDDAADPDYWGLLAMRQQLASFRTAQGQSYRLLPLPSPKPQYADDGHRLPATYANFLIINDAVLMPIYNDPADAAACAIVAEAFPGRAILPIDCRVLIGQHGSLHCMTMQFPAGVLPAIAAQ